MTPPIKINIFNKKDFQWKPVHTGLTNMPLSCPLADQLATLIPPPHWSQTTRRARHIPLRRQLSVGA